MAHPFVELAPEYEHDLAVLQVTKPKEVDRASDKLLVFVRQGRYAEVSEQLGIPQIFIAASFERESGSDFGCSPAQGDPWNRVSTHVPRGLGPYSDWKASAISAYKIDRLDQVGAANWTWARFCYESEAFNGFGPRNHGKNSGYPWAGTNIYTNGKYVADSVWDPNAVDTQLGTVPIAVAMVHKMPALDLPGWPGAVAGAIPSPLSVPAGVGGLLPARGALTGTQWLQDSLNKLMLPTGDHLIVDGNYGRHTSAAVRTFQAFVGITADGLIGDETCAAIDAALIKLQGR